MDDKEIKRHLKDASLYLSDASKRWPKHKEIAANNLNGAMAVLDKVYDYVYRPLGGEYVTTTIDDVLGGDGV